MKLEFYVLIDDVNNGCLRSFNIFNNYYLSEFVEKYKKTYKKNRDIDEFIKELNSILMYCFWSKCEYELMFSDLFERYECKVDVYERLKPNINIIADIILKYWGLYEK